MTDGRIIKALSGFYYVKAGGETYQCRGRGIFRKQNITPLVGDFVVFESNNAEEGQLQEIKPRKNELIRPPVSNIDQAIIVSSAKMPDFNPLLLDRFLVLIESKDIKPVIFITKKDLISSLQEDVINYYQKVYQEIGYPVELLSSKENIFELDRLTNYFANNVSVIAGQSGVGKSSLLNAINPSLELETNAISKSLGRGKHTTRHVELVKVANGLVADTPGFSSLEFNGIEAVELDEYFPEMRIRKEDCKFRGCLHNKEPKCAVKQAVENSGIAPERYEHYLRFLEEINARKMRY